MKRVALALSALLFAACDPRISALTVDAGAWDPNGTECETNPCLNSGVCHVSEEGFQCACPPGFEGDICEVDVDDCDPNPCKNDGLCSDRVAGYSCACAPGFTGVDCSTNVDECAAEPCDNGGTCTDLVNGYQCACAAGYSGSRCEVNVDDCATTPCENGGDCQDEVNGFTCTCTVGNVGPTCSNQVETCAEDTCQHGGTCEDSDEGYVCTCAPGYNGANCDNDIDDCASLPCLNGANCVDQVNGYDCECPDGYEGVNCEHLVDLCNPNPCQNGGACANVGDYFECSCSAGYNGTHCEHNIDDCASDPCANGGTCTDQVNGFSCECMNGFSGPTCNNESPTCPAPNPCDHGECRDGTEGYRCECDAGFTGASCEVNVDDCELDPCEHGTCADEDNAYSCTCDPGYEGPQCQTDIDDCALAPCKNGGTCADLLEGFSCACAPGWAGETCEDNIDECDPNPCMNGGTCTDEVNGYTCECLGGFSGDQCEEEHCGLVGVCGNGMCDGQGGCTCDEGWQGADCRDDIDECATGTPCLNGGMCDNTAGGFSCGCATGYQGQTCEQCADGYQDDDADDVCCAVGYQGSLCNQCDVGFEDRNGVCQRTCSSAPKDCGDHGVCDDAGGDTVCMCDPDYYGDLCDSLMGTCTQEVCGDHGTCEPTSSNTYQCSCEPGYVGRTCETRDECVLEIVNGGTPCLNDGVCVDGDNSYTCMCVTGWTGADCGEPEECELAVLGGGAPCNGNGTCVDGDGGYTCTCDSGWLGVECTEPDDCVGHLCQNGSTCVDGDNTYTCQCTSGWLGADCSEVDDCVVGVPQNGPCSGNGVCTDGDSAYSCVCDSGWLGATCDEPDNCVNDPCQNGGTCTDGDNMYTCQCPSGWLGTDCTEVDDCVVGVPQDGPCTGHGACTDGDNAYTCACDSGWLGATCSEPDDCASGPCQNGGACTDGDNTYTCQCASGWLGPDCTEIDDCVVNVPPGGPCSGHGVCTDGNNDYMCACESGWLGATCSEPDDCVTNNCQNGATCVDGDGGYTCACTSGWTGADCSEVDNCVVGVPPGGPCSGHGVCTDGDDAYTCQCDAGWLEADCSEQDDCVGHLCENGGTCVDGDGAYTCDCTGLDYEGPFCQSEIDNCAGNPCLHGGVCTDIGLDFSCDCARTGYTGETCQNDLDECGTVPSVCGDGACVNVSSGGGYTCQCPDGTLDLGADGTQCVQITSVYAGALNTCAITTAGSLHCWGDNAFGQLAQGHNDNPANAAEVRTPKRIGTGTGWTKVSVGGRHICGLRGGHLFCWGANQNLQNAVPSAIAVTRPTEVRPDLSWTDVAVGESHSCGLAGTALYCWGNSADLQAGAQNTGTNVDVPQQIAGTWSSVSAGAYHTCAINTADELHCWGRNSSGQTAGAQPIPVPGGMDVWSSVEAGPTHTCAVAGAQTYCWGEGSKGALGNGASMDNATPQQVSFGQSLDLLATGEDYSCGVVPTVPGEFQVYCWGTNDTSMLLTGGGDVSAPVLVATAGSPDWSAYAVGDRHMCAVDGGFVHCWGGNTDGAVGSVAPGTTINVPTRVRAATVAHSGSNYCDPNPCKNGGVCTSSLSGFTCNCTGTGFSGATCTSTSDECAMNAGICGDGTCRDLLDNAGYSCTCPDGLIDVDHTGTVCESVGTIVAGTNHTCVLTESAQTLHCWGTNRYGQFGLGMVGTSNYYPNENSQTIRTPLRLSSVSGVTGAASGWTQLAVGEGHTCATLPTGSGPEGLYCWGTNALGQVGRAVAGAQDLSAAPHLLDATRTWQELRSAYSHTCGITSGALYCWGSNNQGQTGAGMTSTTFPFSLSTPVAVPPTETSWVSVAPGAGHTCAITNTGSTYCWGLRNRGQVGIGTTGTAVLVPTKVDLPDPQGFTAIQADFFNSCGLVGTSAYCWGQGTSGAIGDGFEAHRSSPTAVFGGLSFSRITSGTDFACGLVAVDGSMPTVYTASCWGNNARNMLLTGGGNVNIPTPVTTRQWRLFDVGATHVCGVDDSDGKLYCWGDNGSESGVGTGKVGHVRARQLGAIGIGAVKAAAADHPVP